MNNKKRTFHIYADDIGYRVLTGDSDAILNYIRRMLMNVEQGGVLELEIIRLDDMTDEEIEAILEQ